jgi:hypothetical protein
MSFLGLDFRLLTDVNGQPGGPITNVTDGTHEGIEVGDTFWLEVLAWDQGSRDVVPSPSDPNGPAARPGVISLPLHLLWDEDIIEFLGPDLPQDAPPTAAVPAGNSLVTPSFTQQRLVDAFPPEVRAIAGFSDILNIEQLIAVPNLDDLSSIAGLRGGALPIGNEGQPIGEDGPNGTLGPSQTPGAADDRTAWFSRLQFRAAAPGQTPFVIVLPGSMSFANAAVLEEVGHLAPNWVAALPSSSTQAPPTVTETIVVASAPQRQSLSGFVYADTNLNGVFDREVTGNAQPEVGLPNVTLRLFRSGESTVLAETTTGADGWYNFEIADPGTYTVVEVQPAGFVEGTVTRGLVIQGDNNPPEARGTIGTNQISNIVLDAGDRGVDYNFGENISPNKRLFLASTRPREELFEALGVESVTVEGTSGNDTIAFQAAGDTLSVTVNGGQPQEFPLAQAQIVIVDALAGDDQVTLNGTDADDVAHLTLGNGTLHRGQTFAAGNFAVLALSAEQLAANGGSAGEDLAVLDDSPQADLLEAGTGTPAGNNAAILRSGDLLAQAISFERVRAVTPSAVRAANPQDSANLGPTSFTLELMGDWM